VVSVISRLHRASLARLRAAGLGLALSALTACGAPTTPPTEQSNTAQSATATSADQTTIAYQAQGEGDVALVFVHGWSCDSSYWSAQVPAFASDFRVITVDLAGHGASGAERTNWSIPAFGEDVAAVIHAIPDRRIILIGHSMGGPVVLEAARRFPNRVIGVIGVDTLNDLAGPNVPPEAAQQVMTSLRADSAAGTRTLAAQFFFAPDTNPQLVQRITDDMASAPSAVAVASMDALLRYDPKPTAAELRIPITAINADHQPAMDEAAARRVAPQFRLVTMTDVSHFLQIEAPDRFNETLRAEVARIVTPSEQRAM
jgi:pimeloyl-ACP methyl ester carboxylesterase